MKRLLALASLAILLTIGADSLWAQARFEYCYVSGNTTKTCRTGGGMLYSVTINTRGAGLSTATLYDNTAGSGTVIAVIDMSVCVCTLTYLVRLTNGLTVVAAMGAVGNLTIVTD